MMLAILLAAATCPNPDALPAPAAAARCRGVELAAAERWRDAAAVFEAAARGLSGEGAAGLWTQAGNAWLAAGEPVKAGTALDAALVSGADQPATARGELMLDRARAAVAAGDLDAARPVLDKALALAPADPIAWLFSATLARRMGQPARAAIDIAQALRRAPEDAAVQLEAGNIAALAGDEPGASERWTEAARLDPTGAAAAKALGQFVQPPSPRP